MEENKKYYEICQKEQWDIKEINIFCKKNKINFIDFKNKVKSYINTNLTKNILELNEKQITLIYNQDMVNVINSYKKIIIEIENNNPHLDLWSNLITLIKEYLFNFFISVNFDLTKISQKMQELNLPLTKTCEIVAKYALNIKKWDRNKMKQCFSHLVTKKFGTVYEVLEKILLAESDMEVIDLIDNSLQSFTQLKFQIHNFVINSIYDCEYEKTKQILETKLENYKNNHLKENRIKKKEISNNEIPSKTEIALSQAKINIKAFLESDVVSRSEYLQKTNIKPSLFNSHVHLIKQHDQDLYNLYKKKINLFMGINYSRLVGEIYTIVDGLKNGIEFNNHTRPFDILDYYQTTKMKRYTCLKLAKQLLETNDSRLLSIFFERYNTSKPIRNIQALLEEKTILGMQLDKNKQIIPNSGYEVSKEDKLNVINYLKNNNIPLYDDIYIIALRRYVNKELIIDTLENKTSNLKKR